MKKWLNSWITMAGTALLMNASLLAAAPVPFDPSEGVYDSGDWRYVLVNFNSGTQDEAAIGKLQFRGKEVIGNPDDRIECELGEFLWSPYSIQAGHSGWRRINPEKKYSRWQRVEVDEKKEGATFSTKPIQRPQR